MSEVKRGLDTINDITRVTNFIPTIGTLISTVVQTVSSVEDTFNQAYRKVQEIDGKVNRFKSIASTAAQTSERGEVSHLGKYLLWEMVSPPFPDNNHYRMKWDFHN